MSQKFKKGDIVETTDFHLKGVRYVLILRFNHVYIPMWAAYQVGKPFKPIFGANLRESTMYKPGNRMFKVDYSSINASELIHRVKNRDKKAIQEFVKRYKKLPKIK